MKIIDIKEAGANNLLRYARKHNASLRDEALVSLINDETFYLVSLSDVSFFEVFRLTQMYRDKLRVLSSERAEVPSPEELQGYFRGASALDDNEPPLAHSTTAESCIRQWMHLIMQMLADSSLVEEGAARLFIPMLSRKYTLQIPVSFYDFLSSMSDKEIDELYSDKYPNTLMDIAAAPVHGVKTTLFLGIAKATRILRYDRQYDKYLNQLRYFSLLASVDSTKLYQLGLLGFLKRDPVARTELRFSLFNQSREAGLKTMRRIAKLHTPLVVDFVVRLPIEYMQLILNSYGREILPVQYESSMTNILETGMRFENFKRYEATGDDTDATKAEEHENAIDAYRVRIAEANENTLKTIQLLLKSREDDTNTTAIFSLLPSIYQATAVLSINTEYLKLFTSHTDPVLHDLFFDISEKISQISEDLKNSKD